MTRTYLVTGSSGFVGSHLTGLLHEKNCFIRALSRHHHAGSTQHASELVQGDMTDPESLHGIAAGIDTIIHAAGSAHSASTSGDLHYRTTVEGTRTLLTEAEQSGVKRFVFISSVKAMPDPGDDCIDETVSEAPSDEYGLSRYHAEELVRDAGRKTGMHVCIIRPVLVYGAGVKGNLASLVRAIHKGYFPPIPDTGNRRSMVDVRDLVDAVLLACEKESANGTTCIISDREQYSTRRIYLAILQALGKRTPRYTVPAGLLRLAGQMGDRAETVLGKPAPINTAACDRLLGSACYHSVNAGPTLGFRSRYTLEDALPGMIDTFLQQTES